MDSIKQIDAIEVDIDNKSQLARALILNLKKQAKRFLLLNTKYQSQRQNQGVLSKLQNKGKNFQDIDDYNDLASKQICGRIEDVKDKYFKVKSDVSKLSKDIKTRPTQNYKESIDYMRQRIKVLDDEFIQIWKQEHFLTLNYRLDVSAKQIERWTQVMNKNKVSEQKIRDNIASFFS